MTNGSAIKTQDVPMHGCEQSVSLTLPGCSVFFLECVKKTPKRVRRAPAKKTASKTAAKAKSAAEAKPKAEKKPARGGKKKTGAKAPCHWGKEAARLPGGASPGMGRFFTHKH